MDEGTEAEEGEGATHDGDEHHEEEENEDEEQDQGEDSEKQGEGTGGESDAFTLVHDSTDDNGGTAEPPPTHTGAPGTGTAVTSPTDPSQEALPAHTETVEPIAVSDEEEPPAITDEELAALLTQDAPKTPTDVLLYAGGGSGWTSAAVKAERTEKDERRRVQKKDARVRRKNRERAERGCETPDEEDNDGYCTVSSASDEPPISRVVTMKRKRSEPKVHKTAAEREAELQSAAARIVDTPTKTPPKLLKTSPTDAAPGAVAYKTLHDYFNTEKVAKKVVEKAGSTDKTALGPALKAQQLHAEAGHSMFHLVSPHP